MQRSAWIFIAAIVLPSLGLAWLAVHSVRDQQVVLEHQQAIICQNITDALAKSIQGQMDQVRGDFVKATDGVLGASKSPQMNAQNFNRQIKAAWPMAEIGFAVNLDGNIYSPRAGEGAAERTFRDENDRFLSNRENVEIYSSNSMAMNNQSASNVQNAAAAQAAPKLTYTIETPSRDKKQEFEPEFGKNLDSASQKAVPAQLPLNKSPMGGSAKDEADGAPATVSGAVTLTPTGSVTVSGGAVYTSPTEVASDLDRNKTYAPGDMASRTPAPAQNAPATAAAASPTTTITSTLNTDSSANSSPTDSFKEVQTRASGTTGSGASAAKLSIPDASSAAPASTSAPLAPATPAVEQELESRPPQSALADSPSTTPANGNAAISNSSAFFNNSGQPFAKIARKVIPQQNVQQDVVTLSNTVPEESDFRRAIGEETSGELARFLENKMRLLVWSHASADATIVYGAQLNQKKLVEMLKTSFQIPELAPGSFSTSSLSSVGSNYCVAIIDDTGHPVAQSRSDFKGDWKHPLVSTEIGEVLPHWEAALYLVDPGQIGRTARTLQFTLGLIVLLLVTAIVAGGSLIAADVRRQVRLAQQKTDFVSNVSHELKTPLTSIRMFADLLADKRVPDEERQATYLRIIAAEAARLTRLINNVLDFARLERGAPPGEHRACDLVEATRDVVETCAPHLEASGVTFRSEIETETLPINGDRDALAQIILNLVSNAEKYGGNDVLVRVRRQETPAAVLGCVDVLDRGAGIPAKQVKTVFEPFHRLDDSLSSGIPGSGLGLTLARRMARAHGGDVTYSPRAGGGSCFTLTVPLTTKT